MKTAFLILWLSLTGGALAARDGIARLLLSQDLDGYSGRELVTLTVEYAPGESTPAHMHHAQALVSVLEGSVQMQVEGAAPVAGQTWPEGPGDLHVVSRNASNSARTRYLAVMAKNKGMPILSPN